MTEPRETACLAIQEQLSNYLDQELERGSAGKIEEHLAGCAVCREFLVSLRKSIELCRQAPRPCVGEECYQRALAKAREELERRGLIGPPPE